MMYLGLEGKKILIGITGSISAYKVASLVSSLMQLKAQVSVIMTPDATRFIGPATFQALTNGRLYLDLYEGAGLGHIQLTQEADVFLIAPATANTIGKIVGGIADNLLTAAALAMEKPLLIAPAMNSRMFRHLSTQKNIAILEERGVKIIAPSVGYLACGDKGEGRLAELDDILAKLSYVLTEKDLQGLSFLITAGPTREAMDEVRFISNYSTGRMGFALAWRAVMRGGEVLLVTGPSQLKPPHQATCIWVEDAQEMYHQVMKGYPRSDVVIKAAAVSDYRPQSYYEGKQKKENKPYQLNLIPNPDILATLGQKKQGNVTLVGFAAEVEDPVSRAQEKLFRKNLDMIVVNDISREGAGFGSLTNIVTLVDREGAKEYPCLKKEEVADIILDAVLAIRCK